MATSVEIRFDPGLSSEPGQELFRQAGGELSGAIVVRTDGMVECRAIRLVVTWRTEGRGDRDEATAEVVKLHEGPLAFGQQEFPFRLTLPMDPISYRGHYVSVVWTATARVDIAGEKDPSTEQTFYLVPAVVS